MEQLDLLEMVEKEDRVNKQLAFIQSLLEKGKITKLEVVAINKLYDYSFLGRMDGRLKSFSIFDRPSGIELRAYEFQYPFERVVNGTLNFILVE